MLKIYNQLCYYTVVNKVGQCYRTILPCDNPAILLHFRTRDPYHIGTEWLMNESEIFVIIDGTKTFLVKEDIFNYYRDYTVIKEIKSDIHKNLHVKFEGGEETLYGQITLAIPNLPDFINEIKYNTGWAGLGLNGDLGFEEYKIDSEWDNFVSFGIHPNASLEINLKEDCNIFGTMNSTSLPGHIIELMFFINEEFIGSVNSPKIKTKSVRLLKGKNTIRLIAHDTLHKHGLIVLERTNPIII